MELENLEKKSGLDPGQHGITEERASFFSAWMSVQFYSKALFLQILCICNLGN